MFGREGLVPRLEALFGGVWQAALDHAGMMSRRRACGIGAGEAPSAALWAVIELLERLPPPSGRNVGGGLGKVAETCPTLTMRPERLVDGKIRPEDAVLVWDLRPGHANVAGFLPRGCFAGLARADAARTSWRLWYSQWDDCHGGGAAAGWMASEGETPERLLAAWWASGAIDGADLQAALDVLSARIAGFSPSRFAEAVERRRALRDRMEARAEAEANTRCIHSH